MHAATSYSQITASFDAALLQLDTSGSSPGSSSGEQSPQILHSPIRWDKRHLQPIKIEINEDTESVQSETSPILDSHSPLNTQTFFLQPVQNTREKLGRERPVKKVNSLRKILEDDGSNSDTSIVNDPKPSKSKSFSVPCPYMMNGDDHSISGHIKTKQNFQSSSPPKLSQGKHNKYKLLSDLKEPLVNGTDYAKKPEKCAKCIAEGEECSNLSPTLKGNNSEESVVKFCISNSSDEEDNSDVGSTKAEFMLDI